MSDDHGGHHVNYLIIFFALCGFTAVSVITDMVQFESKAVLAVVVLSVSTAKALCVMAYFMHLKFEKNWKYVLLAPTTILAMGLPLALLPDIGAHYYMVAAPQETELRNAVRELIAKENKSKPHTDEDLRKELKTHYHYDVSVAMVERYRNILGIADHTERSNTR